MPRNLDELVALLELEQIEDHLFRGHQPETLLQRVFGGQVLGQALAAAQHTVTGRPVHSLHGYFLRPGDPHVPILYDVEPIRDGGSFSTRRVVARQHSKPIFHMSASFHAPEEGLEHQDLMPDAGDPERAHTLAEVYERVRPGRTRDDWKLEWAALEARYAGDSVHGLTDPDPTRPAQARVWLRTAGTLPDDPGLHACLLAYASDLTLLFSALIPHRLVLGDPGLMLASLDHAIWFHRPFRADGWLLYDLASPSAGAGRALTTGRLFDRSGRLVASVVQEGLVRQLQG